MPSINGLPVSDGFCAYPAPAKLNLFLHITGRREDGYHLLQSVFRILDWGDTVYLKPTDDGVIARDDDGIEGVDDADDLMIRAAKLLQQHSGTTKGARIKIDKRIPMGGGMGGGSSDAATVLVALNQLWGLNRSLSQLAEMGLTLGADVPVFVFGENAFAEGIGEQLTPIELPKRWYLCVMPGVSTGTAKLFANQSLTRDSEPVKISNFLEGHVQGNAFEPVLRRLEPAVEQVFALMNSRISATPRLTGTGSVVFAEFPDRDSAQASLQVLPTGLNAWVAASADHSPLHAAVSANHNEFLQGCRQEA